MANPLCRNAQKYGLSKALLEKQVKYRGMEEEQVSKVGVATRNVSSLRIPVARGLMSLSVGVPCRKSWNLLPARIKDENNKKKVLRLIKACVAQRPRKK